MPSTSELTLCTVCSNDKGCTEGLILCRPVFRMVLELRCDAVCILLEVYELNAELEMMSELLKMLA